MLQKPSNIEASIERIGNKPYYFLTVLFCTALSIDCFFIFKIISLLKVLKVSKHIVTITALAHKVDIYHSLKIVIIPQNA